MHVLLNYQTLKNTFTFLVVCSSSLEHLDSLISNSVFTVYKKYLSTTKKNYQKGMKTTKIPTASDNDNFICVQNNHIPYFLT